MHTHLLHSLHSLTSLILLIPHFLFLLSQATHPRSTETPPLVDLEDIEMHSSFLEFHWKRSDYEFSWIHQSETAASLHISFDAFINALIWENLNEKMDRWLCYKFPSVLLMQWNAKTKSKTQTKVRIRGEDSVSFHSVCPHNPLWLCLNGGFAVTQGFLKGKIYSTESHTAVRDCWMWTLEGEVV